MTKQEDNRVLGRRGARDLNQDEISKIQGGAHTLTICTPPSARNPKGDGDPGECG